MSLQCPQCQSERIDVRNIAKKAIGSLGTVIGCVGGVAAELNGARIGTVIGGPFGPIGSTIGALIGGLVVGGIAGCTAGASLGEMVDENILDNYRCLDCGYTFSLHRPVLD